MLARDEPLRALETLSIAAKYVNSKLSRVKEPDNDIVGAINVDVSIGSVSTSLGHPPESLAEVKISPALSILGGARYWFQSQQTANDFQETDLQLRLKLKLA